MKKFLKIFALTIVLSIVLVLNQNINAASCSINASAVNAYVGDQVNINVIISDAATWNVHIKGSGITDAVVGYEPDGNNTSLKKTYSLNTSSVNNYTVSISGDITDKDGNNKSVSGSVTVKVTERPKQTTNNHKTNVDTRSSNNYLSSLSVDGYELSPAFDANTNNYTMNVGYDVSELKISGIPADNKSRTVVEGNLDLVAGENNVTVTVTAENGYKRVYTITVTKEKNPDDIDATIESLVINNAVLKNEFASDVVEYMCDDITADIEKLDILVQTKIPEIKYEIIGNDELKQGINHVIVKVTSRDGSVTKEYEIIVFKTNEYLPLEDVMAEPIEPTFFDIVMSMKTELIIGGGILLGVIVVSVIVIVVVKKKSKREDKEVVEDSNEEQNEEENVLEESNEVEETTTEIEETTEEVVQESEEEKQEEIEKPKTRKGRLAKENK